MGLVKLGTVVGNVMVGEAYDSSRHETYLQYAINGLRDLQTKAGQIKSIRLSLDGSKTVALPSDFLQLSKVGMEVCGRICVLTVNNSLAPEKEACECDDTVDTAIQEASKCYSDDSLYGYGYSFYNYFSSGQFYGRIFGYGAGNVTSGTYRLDRDKRQLQFSSFVPTDEIILEYLSNGLDLKGETFIDEIMLPVMINYVKWKVEEDKISPDLRMINYWELQYEKAKKTYVAAQYHFTFEDFKVAASSGYHQAPKN